jgi:hypothetical protein
VVDVSDPTAPATVATPLVTQNDRIAVSGNYAYMSGETFEIVDISDPTAPVLLASLETPDGRGVAIDSSYAYVAANGHGFYVIDITDAAAPTLVGQMSTAGNIQHIELSGDYAYLADDTNDMQIMDISALDPTHVSRVTPAEILASNLVPVTYDVVVSGSYAYLAAEYGGFDLVDVSDPMSPLRVGGLSPREIKPYTVEVRGNYAYIGDAKTYPGAVKIADISDPTNPGLVGSVTASSGPPSDLAVSGNYAYYASRSGTYSIEIFNISNPSAPVLASTIDCGASAKYLTISGNRLYAGTGDSRVRTFDITTPTAAVQIGAFGSRSYEVAVVDDYAYVAAGDHGLEVYDVTDLATPVLVGGYTANKGDVKSVAVDGNGIYVGEYGYGLVHLQAYP